MSVSEVILLALGATVLFWAVGAYNRLVRLRNEIANAFAQIDVQLKRRHDLIPNLAGRRRHGGGLAQLHVVRAFDRPLRLGHARQCGAQSGQASHAKGVQRKLTTVHERDPFRVRRTHF